jgi:S1-C subfamily serine protease
MKTSGWKQAAVTVAALACVLAGGSLAEAQTLKYPVGMLGKYTPDGMLIQKVVSDTPADKAGLQSGDLILKVDGRLITNQDDFVGVINTSGGQVVLVVKKGGNGKVCRVGLDLASTNKQGPPAPYFLGVIGTFTPDGMRVANAIPGTPAARAGLDKGDIIFRIDGIPITNQNDFFTVLYKSGGSVTLSVKKAGGKLVKQDVDLTTYELGAVGEFGRDGMTIGVVAPATPAAYVGLQKGDRILRIDNQAVRSQKEFDRLINNSGGVVTLTVQRPGQQPTRLQVELTNNQLGAWCEPATEGMRLTAVVPGSPADIIGLERGDVIVKIDDQRMRSNADLISALRNARGLVTLVVRKGRTDRLVRLDVDLAR